MKSIDTQDPIVLAQVERALEPYRAFVPPDLLQVFREELIYAMTEGPVLKELVNRLRDRPAVEHSGATPTQEADADKKAGAG